MIAGTVEQSVIASLSPGEDPSDFGRSLAKAIDSVETGNGVLVLTDLKGGTPFNQSLLLSQNKNIQILCGSNLPLSLSAVLTRQEEMSLTDLTQAVMEDAYTSIDLIRYPR